MHPLIASRLQAEIPRSDGFIGCGAGLHQQPIIHKAKGITMGEWT